MAPLLVAVGVAVPLLVHRSSQGAVGGASTPYEAPLQWTAGAACGMSDPRDDLSGKKVFFNNQLPSSALPVGADPTTGSTDAWQVSSDAGGGVLAYSEVTPPGEDGFLEITCPDGSHVEKDLSQ